MKNHLIALNWIQSWDQTIDPTTAFSGQDSLTTYSSFMYPSDMYWTKYVDIYVTSQTNSWESNVGKTNHLYRIQFNTTGQQQHTQEFSLENRIKHTTYAD